tara:strand:- start:1596 stop:3503 length:1908 start_codon:yes stop_codon:yes gene_type:complete
VLFDYTNISIDSINKDCSESLNLCRKIVEEVKNLDSDKEKLSKMNTLENILYNLNGRTAFLSQVHPEEKIRKECSKVEATIQNYFLQLTLDKVLFEVINGIELTNLSPIYKRYHDFLIRDFEDAGQFLTNKDRVELEKIEKELIDLGIEFEENIAKDKTQLVFNKSQLEGITKNELGSFMKEGDKFLVTMAYPHISAVMENCSVRKTREKVWKAFSNRATDNNPDILVKATALRKRKAELHKKKTWSEYRLRHRMSKSPTNVQNMYNTLLPMLQKKGEEEVSMLINIDKNLDKIAVWDVRYLIAKERSRLSNIDTSKLKEYFELHHVKTTMLEICEEVFDLKFVQQETTNAWHKDVELWEVYDGSSDNLLAYFYLDLYPREGKFTHAAVMDISPGNLLSNVEQSSCSMVANFPNPNLGKALMSFDEVETLFHEFGHVLHHCLGSNEISRLSGTSVEWDFVEAPSQIMEHWVWQPECINRLAIHYHDGKKLDMAIIEKLKESKNIGVALNLLRQIGLGMEDQLLHGIDFDKSHDEIVRKALVSPVYYPVEEVNHLASFGHMMGGYDSAYYGYLWAEIIGDDLFSRFEDEGVLSPKIGKEYRDKILSHGGSKDAQTLVESFLGRNWDYNSFLKQKAI